MNETHDPIDDMQGPGQPSFLTTDAGLEELRVTVDSLNGVSYCPDCGCTLILMGDQHTVKECELYQYGPSPESSKDGGKA